MPPLTPFKILAGALACLLVAACGGGAEPQGRPASAAALPAQAAQPPGAASTTGMAVLGGNRADYAITLSSSGYVAQDLTGDGGVQTFAGVQAIRFADMTVNLGIGAKSKTLAPPDLKSLIELYIAFFNRLPDADGLSFWIDQFNAGLTLVQIADRFYASAVYYPSLTGYSAAMSNADFVCVIYKNVLGRSGATAPPDADVQWWANELASGRESKGSLIVTMLRSAHSFAGNATWGWVASLLDNKYLVGRYFAVQQGLNYNTAELSITRTTQFAAAVTPTGTTAAISAIGMRDASFDLVTLQVTPIPAPIVPIPVAQKAVAFQMDAAHSGAASFGQALVFRSAPAWKLQFSGAVSYPLIADGRVFVSVAGPSFGANGTWLLALDAAAGRLLWGPVTIPSTSLWSTQAYDNGTVYVANSAGDVQAIDAASGQTNWQAIVSPALDMQVHAAVTAANGVVYVSQYHTAGLEGAGTAVYALDGATGARLWAAPAFSSGGPAVAAGGVFISHPCTAQKFAAQGGAAVWTASSGCAGGGGRIPVFANGSLYVRGYSMTDASASVILNAGTGAAAGTFRSNIIPAVNSTTLFSIDTVQGGYVKTGDLVATDLQTGQPRWTFRGDGYLNTAPIVIDQTVIAGSQQGMLYALNAATGAPVWSASSGAGNMYPDDEQNISQPLSGFAAGEGYLLTPMGNTLSSWRIVAGAGASTVAAPSAPPAGSQAAGEWAHCAVAFVRSAITMTTYQFANVCEQPISLSYKAATGAGQASQTMQLAAFEIRQSAVAGNLSWAACPAGMAAVNAQAAPWTGGRHFCH